MLFKGQKPTIEQLQNRYPSIFAEHASEETSDKYLYIPTFKLIEGLQKNGFEIAGAKQQGSRTVENKDFGKHVVYMTKGDVNHSLKVGEEFPMLALTNSHNAKSSFKIDTAFFRLACSNGLLMPSQSLNSARIGHRTGMEHEVIDAAYRVVANFDAQIETVSTMKQITLNNDEQKLLAESASMLAFDEEQIQLNKERKNDIAPKLLKVRRSDDNKNDLWTTFNRIQENIIKGGINIVTKNEKGDLNLRRTRAVKAIDRDARLNKELMTLALKFAELKGAA